MTNDGADTPVDPVTTGVSGLDEILGGGLVSGGLYLVEGMAGAGKTILSSQIAFHRISKGERVLYMTLIAESHSKLLAHLKPLSFYDERAISDKLLFVSGYHELMTAGLNGFLRVIAATLRSHRPALLVVDGFRSAREFSSTDLQLSQFIHELNALVTAANCTTLLLAPLSGNEPRPEHTLVDGLIELNRISVGMRRSREVEVHKLRSRNHLLGKHFFKITDNGLVTFPRLEAMDSSPPGVPDLKSRRDFAVPGFDDMLGGGLVKGSTTTLLGPSGIGKTLLALKFIEAGVRRGERCVYFGFYESPARLLGKAESVGIQLSEAINDGRLLMQWQPAIEQAIDELADRLLRTVIETNASRVVIDGIEGFRDSALRGDRIGLFLNALTHRLREAGVTTLMTEELPLWAESIQSNPLRASAMTENIVLMRYVETGARLQRLISVIKLRESAHDPSIRALTIDASGLKVTDSFVGVSGLLAGRSVALVTTPTGHAQ
ncbi:MAG TPA: ATPase domain-containing protein [Pararobbsia sp.]|nr:ATPase domain-containing protein [Pararobbsia sp.]